MVVFHNMPSVDNASLRSTQTSHVIIWINWFCRLPYGSLAVLSDQTFNIPKILPLISHNHCYAWSYSKQEVIKWLQDISLAPHLSWTLTSVVLSSERRSGSFQSHTNTLFSPGIGCVSYYHKWSDVRELDQAENWSSTALSYKDVTLPTLHVIYQSLS